MAKTLAEIEQEFTTRLRAASEDDKPAIELAFERERANFYQSQAEEQQIDLWKKEALIAYPKARPKEITGRTQEAIMAEAKSSHDEVEAMLKAAAEEQRKKDEEEAARAGWGPSGVGGGGGGGNRSTSNILPADKQFEKDVEEYHEGLRQGTLTRQTAERGERARIGTIAEYFTDPNAVDRARRRR